MTSIAHTVAPTIAATGRCDSGLEGATVGATITAIVAVAIATCTHSNTVQCHNVTKETSFAITLLLKRSDVSDTDL